MRDTFVYERWSDGGGAHELILLAGVPLTWFAKGRRFRIVDAPIPNGRLSLECASTRGTSVIQIAIDIRGPAFSDRVRLSLPFRPQMVRVNEVEASFKMDRRGNVQVVLPPESRQWRVELLHA